jgi:hypothetical protein
MRTTALYHESKEYYCRRELWSETRELERGGRGGRGEVIECTSEHRLSELMTIFETEARYSPGTNQMGSVFVVKTLYTL